MKGSTHAIVAGTLAISTAAIYWDSTELFGLPVYPLAMLPTAVAGGLKADIDMPNNPGARNHPILSKFLTHRGLTHTGMVCVAIYLVAQALSVGDPTPILKVVVSLIAGFFLGYCSHVFIDLFNGKGAPLFWPAYLKRFNIMSITSDTFQEMIFVLAWVVLIISHTVLTLGGWTL